MLNQDYNNKNIKTLPILNGELNKLPLSYLDDFLKSDIQNRLKTCFENIKCPS